jgi:hypothetical protein
LYCSRFGREERDYGTSRAPGTSFISQKHSNSIGDEKSNQQAFASVRLTLFSQKLSNVWLKGRSVADPRHIGLSELGESRELFRILAPTVGTIQRHPFNWASIGSINRGGVLGAGGDYRVLLVIELGDRPGIFRVRSSRSRSAGGLRNPRFDSRDLSGSRGKEPEPCRPNPKQHHQIASRIQKRPAQSIRFNVRFSPSMPGV